MGFEFQSTPPVKAATDATMSYDTAPGISIHAAREGGDGIPDFITRTADRFQSTPPVKAATQIFSVVTPVMPFQSTPPVKAATTISTTISTARRISIHAAREGGDRRELWSFRQYQISIHAAREGGDCGNE